MGPPINTWPYSHTAVGLSEVRDKRSIVLVDNFRVIFLNFAFAVVFFQVMTSLSSVGAGPVVLNMDYMQGPVPLARNIRHLPCISRRTGQEGMCMFAIDCLKANGSHLGTCIDRFYFGSCCQMPDKTVLPQIITNHIDDNSIDNANFVHPQTEDKIHNLFPPRKPTTQKVETTTKEAATDSVELETKSDEQTTIDNKIISEVKTTAVVVETTTKLSEKTQVTETPIKLSTFQTVSSDFAVSSTEKAQTEVTVASTSTTEKTRKPTRRPVKPFTRPGYKPYNSTRPLYTLSTLKPKPPVALYNTTRKPPYRPPPNRYTTKRPFPIPPRLNITILPQSTSSKPLLTRPSSASITYINATVSTTKEEPKTTTTSTTTTPSTTTTEKVVETTEAIETTILTTEQITEKAERITTEAPIETVSTEVEKATTNQDIEKETSQQPDKEIITQEDDKQTNQEAETQNQTPEIETSQEEAPNQTGIETSQETTQTVGQEKPQDVEKETNQIEKETTPVEKVTAAQEVTEKIKPATEADVLSTFDVSTEYPALVTWTNTIDAVTKAPEKATESSEEIWSPITPPEGWILLSTIKPESTTTTTTTEAPTTEPTTQQETTIQIDKIETTEKTIEVNETPEPIITTASTTVTTEATTTTSTEATTTSTTTEPSTTKSTSESTTASSTTSSTTEASTQAILEFTVNVTLSPTVPTSTSSVGLTTFTSVSTVDNSTKVNETETSSPTTGTDAPTTTEISLENLGNDKNDYKKVCGRRLWQEPTKVSARIVGGEKSGFGMWPWQISLRQYRTSTYLHKCGAALLNENWAITAAHCVEHVPPSELLVRLGEHDLADENEPYGFAERRVQIVASHPHFDPATFEYDLALLRFYEPVKFQPNILPVCVPDTDEDFVGKTAFVTGWGRLYDEGPLPSVLQEVNVPVINNSACEAMYQAAGYNEHIPNIFICAGWSKGGTDSCEGDSGGPMVIRRERDGRFVLGGIISWGIGCAEPNQPGVYTRISEFRDWINQILQF